MKDEYLDDARELIEDQWVDDPNPHIAKSTNLTPHRIKESEFDGNGIIDRGTIGPLPRDHRDK